MPELYLKEPTVRGCLHDFGATFIPARVHSGSLLWLCIRLHDTRQHKLSCRRESCRRESCRRKLTPVLVPERDFYPGTKIHSGVIKHSFMQTRCCFSSRPGMKVAPLSCKHPLIYGFYPLAARLLELTSKLERLDCFHLFISEYRSKFSTDLLVG